MTPEAPHDDAPEWRNFYGRRFGKTLRTAQKTYLSQDLETLRPKGIQRWENPQRLPLELAAIFGDDRPVWLEIGFGGGEHMVHMAARYPGIGLIGCEPFINGVAMLLGKIRAAGVTNLAIHPGDVRDLFDVLPAGFHREGLPQLSRPLAQAPPPPPPLRDAGPPCAAGPRHAAGGRVPGGDRHPRLHAPDAGRGAEGGVHAGRAWTGAPWDDWLSTRYEQKALREGRVPDYATFRRD